MLDNRYKKLEKLLPDDFPFVMDFGTDLCIDGHFNREGLLLLANKILEVFGEREDTTRWGD